MSIFYNIYDKSHEEQTEILKNAKNLCYLWEHDVLDCSKSFSRQNVTRVHEHNLHSTLSNIWFDEVMQHFVPGCHTVFIDRQGYGTWNKPECWEIGFCTMNKGVDHFLFIHVEPSVASNLIKKYNLVEQKS